MITLCEPTKTGREPLYFDLSPDLDRAREMLQEIRLDHKGRAWSKRAYLLDTTTGEHHPLTAPADD